MPTNLKMQSNAKIAICIAVAFSIAFLILFIFLEFYSEKYDIDSLAEKNFYSKYVNPHNKTIVLLGASYVGRLNTTYINEVVSKNTAEHYTVYNMGRSGDFAKDRLPVLDALISSKPQIVFYGIAYWDIGHFMYPKNSISGTVESQQCLAQTSFLPNPNHSFQSILSFFDFGYYKFEDPKQITMNVLLNKDKIENEKNDTKDKYTPFYPAYPTSEKILTDSQLAHLTQQQCTYDDIYQQNTSVAALKQIIERLQQHDIRVALFVVPHSKYALEKVSDSEKAQLEQILSSLSDSYGLHVYSLIDKYQNMTVWNDWDHIAMNESAIIYSDDVSRIIIKEIGR